MGNRLFVRLFHDSTSETPIAGVYYHWSSNTVPALIELHDLAGHILRHGLDDCCDNNIIRLSILRHIQQSGGCLDPSADNIAFARLLFGNDTSLFKNGNRNDGLVVFDPSEISTLFCLANSTADIFLDDHTIFFHAMGIVDTIDDEVIDCYGAKCRDEDLDHPFQLTFSPEEFSFDQINVLLDVFDTHSVVQCGDMIYLKED